MLYITENLVYFLEHGSAALFSECRCLKMLHFLEHGITTTVRRSFEYKDFKIFHFQEHGTAALF